MGIIVPKFGDTTDRTIVAVFDEPLTTRPGDFHIFEMYARNVSLPGSGLRVLQSVQKLEVYVPDKTHDALHFMHLMRCFRRASGVLVVTIAERRILTVKMDQAQPTNVVGVLKKSSDNTKQPSATDRLKERMLQICARYSYPD